MAPLIPITDVVFVCKTLTFSSDASANKFLFALNLFLDAISTNSSDELSWEKVIKITYVEPFFTKFLISDCISESNCSKELNGTEIFSII